jgi:uncharacterized protein YqjF (DUF2071 family)
MMLEWELLHFTDHRPWPVPRYPWVMAQVWQTLLFAHWPLPYDKLRPLVPPELPLDTFDGQAWVGIVPFHIRGLRPHWLPPVPILSTTLELNVRTYVTLEDKPGVYFFSLDASNLAAVVGARIGYRLPYYFARMRCTMREDVAHYASRRIHPRAPGATFEAAYRSLHKLPPAAPGSLEYFLTERYCLYTVSSKRHVYRTDIHHLPWPLQAAEVEIRQNTMALSRGIALPNIPPLLHYAQQQPTIVWWPHKV